MIHAARPEAVLLEAALPKAAAPEAALPDATAPEAAVAEAANSGCDCPANDYLFELLVHVNTHAVNLPHAVTVKNTVFPRSRFACRIQGSTQRSKGPMRPVVYINPS
jgi:hypothetical protein